MVPEPVTPEPETPEPIVSPTVAEVIAGDFIPDTLSYSYGTGTTTLNDSVDTDWTYSGVDLTTSSRYAFQIDNGGIRLTMESEGDLVFTGINPNNSERMEPLRIKANGEFVVNGKTVTLNLDVYRGFSSWLNGLHWVL